MNRSASGIIAILLILSLSFGCNKDYKKEKQENISTSDSTQSVETKTIKENITTQAKNSQTTKAPISKVQTTKPSVRTTKSSVQSTFSQTQSSRLQPTKPVTTMAQPTRTIYYTQNGEQKSITVTLVTGFENEMLASINNERAKQGLSSLALNSKLSEFAIIRAAEAGVRWSHTRPDGTSCFTVLDNDPEFKKQISEAGENLAWNQTTVPQVMTDWMNSPGHRANILKDSYNYVGVACVIVYRDNGSKDHLWAQMFAKVN